MLTAGVPSNSSAPISGAVPPPFICTGYPGFPCLTSPSKSSVKETILDAPLSSCVEVKVFILRKFALLPVVLKKVGFSEIEFASRAATLVL
jgi:hypothetical protein